jgi:hypothetical protein
VFEEARNWYELYKAQDRIAWVVGPGGHGTPLQVREAIYDWMLRWLNDGKGSPSEEKVDVVPDHMLWATERGQVQGRDVSQIIAEVSRPQGPQDGLVQYVRALLRANPANASAPAANLKVQDSTIIVTTPASSRLSGNWLPNTRAWLIGHNLPAMRASEIVEQARLLQSKGLQPKVSAKGVAGVWALLAAVAEPAIQEVLLDGTPVSFESALTAPVHRNLHDAVIPGFSLRWDLEDLVRDIAPRKVRWRNPTDWMGNIVLLKGDYEYTSSDPNVTP